MWRADPPTDAQVRLVSKLRSALHLPDIKLANKMEAGQHIEWLKNRIKESKYGRTNQQDTRDKPTYR